MEEEHLDFGRSDCLRLSWCRRRQGSFASGRPGPGGRGSSGQLGPAPPSAGPVHWPGGLGCLPGDKPSLPQPPGAQVNGVSSGGPRPASRHVPAPDDLGRTLSSGPWAPAGTSLPTSGSPRGGFPPSAMPVPRLSSLTLSASISRAPASPRDSMDKHASPPAPKQCFRFLLCLPWPESQLHDGGHRVGLTHCCTLQPGT